MKKVNRYVPDVPQRIGDRGTEVIERHLAANGVSRAAELSEEAKVRLLREMRAFYNQELPEGLTMLDPRDMGIRGVLRRFWRFVRRGPNYVG